MGIFGRKSGNRAEAAGAADVFTEAERERIEALWRLTALPRAEFDATYGVMLDGFWRYAASARGEAWAALRPKFPQFFSFCAAHRVDLQE